MAIAGLILGILALLIGWLPSSAGFLILANTAAVRQILLAGGWIGTALLGAELFLIAAGLALSGIGYRQARRSNAGADLAITGIITNTVAAVMLLLGLMAWGILALAWAY